MKLKCIRCVWEYVIFSTLLIDMYVLVDRFQAEIVYKND